MEKEEVLNSDKGNVNAYLGKEKIIKLLLKFSLPSVLAMLVAALYNIVDQVFIGQGVGYLGNSATNVVYPFTVLALALALMVGDGASALMSLSFGRNDEQSALKAAVQGIILTVLISIVLTGIGFAFENQILYFFGATEACLQYAKDYYEIILIGIPFYMAVSAWSGIIRAFGSPVYSMLATVLGAVINLILDPVAILWLQWGTKGAAITTILGQFASFIMCLVYFLKLKSLKGKRGLIKPDWSLIGKMARLGISSFIIQISIVIVMAVANRLINVYGPASDYGADIPLAVIGIVMKVFGIVIAFGVGIAVGGQPIIGYNYGAKNYKRVNKTIAWILGLNFGVGLIAMALFELVPQQIIDIFGSNEGDLYNQYAQLCFRIYLSGIALTCLQKAGSIILQSLGKSVESTLLSISRDVVFFVPGLIILAQHYGVTGMLYAAPISDVLSLILTMVLVGVQMNKMKGLGKTETVTADIKKAF